MIVTTHQPDYQSANLNKWEYGGGLYQKHLELYLDAMYAMLKRTGARTVLDAGCGEGVVYRAMKKRGFSGEWMGLDLSEEAVDFARKQNPEATWIAGSVADLPFPDKSFELVFSSQVLEHLPEPDKALREYARCSNKWLLLSVPYEPLFRWLVWASVTFKIGGDPGHVNHWQPTQFRRFVSQAGQLLHWQRTTIYQIALVNL